MVPSIETERSVSSSTPNVMSEKLANGVRMVFFGLWLFALGLVKGDDAGCGAKIELRKSCLVGVLEGLVTFGFYTFGDLSFGGVEATCLNVSVCLADIYCKEMDVFVHQSRKGGLAGGDYCIFFHSVCVCVVVVVFFFLFRQHS